MKTALTVLALTGLQGVADTPAPAEAAPTASALPASLVEEAAALRDRALESSDAWEITRSLTMEVGPRLAGSDGDRAAVAWALGRMRDLDLDVVRTQSVVVPRWERGEAGARVTAPFPQAMAAVALGGSVGTPEDGIEAPVLEVASLEDLTALATTDVSGRIVFINHAMAATRDGSDYSRVVKGRVHGPTEAGARGAVALLLRSVGTSNNRLAHTGTTRYKIGSRRIPAVAISNPDADMLAHQVARGDEVSVHLRVTSRSLPPTVSANVIGEVRGQGRPDEIVLLGAHLDSWDVGTGAFDDGAGVGIVLETLRMIRAMPRRPSRTVRVVLFANEEFGLSGAKAYGDANLKDIARHVLGMEADSGGDRVWQLQSGVGEDALPLVAGIHGLLEPLGVELGDNTAKGGADLRPLRGAGMPVLSVRQDTTRYFDFHHTENDTVDKLDPVAMRQVVASFAVTVWVAANVEQDFGRWPGAGEVKDPESDTGQPAQ